MDYTFDSYHKNDVRFDSTTRLEDIQANFSKGDYVKILDNRKTAYNDLDMVVHTEEELLEWNMSKAFSAQWKPKKKDGCGLDKSKTDWNPLEETDGFHVRNAHPFNTIHPNMPCGISINRENGVVTGVTLTNSTISVGVPSKDHINPSHYQAYIETEVEVLQWLEAMQYLPRFRDPECFKAAVELQGRKYFDRNGGKDAELQELQKGLWYFKFLVAYIKNGNKPIRVKDIDSILNSK